MYDVVIVGGGAAGFYAAIHIAEDRPDLKIAILERGKEVLNKVKVSGGGRCNVTHAEFNPKELASNYPRGEKELLGPFHNYATGDTIHFFEKRGITLKIEEDGRMFPISDSSQTIVDCFTSEARRLGIETIKICTVTGLEFVTTKSEDYWKIATSNKSINTKRLLLCTGSNTKIWNLLTELGHTIVPPVPSLFTFNIKDNRINNIPGLSTYAEVSVLDNKKHFRDNLTMQDEVLSSEGPLLITHWGMSDPAILKLSAWGARLLESYNYQFKIKVNWVPNIILMDYWNCS
ncbi:aminoacetone oxidase family FAD-binding enzyme [Maribacter litopenaei]|uniref:aminoacetone oxidase family FAD-binding enzyme n=1 Tax=Maribacter litopenaei TaxID=2976127 RepID=UPI0030844F35